MFDTGMKLKKEKKKKISIHCSSEINTFQDLLQCLSESVRNLHCLLFMLTVWHHDSRSRTLETVSPYQLNTVLKLCHLSCIHRNSWSASQFQRNQLNSVFESCFTFVVRLFHCLTAHKLVKFITTQMFFHFHVANIMAPGLMSYLCSPVPSSLAPSELQCGLYALWLVTFSVSWSVYMSEIEHHRWLAWLGTGVGISCAGCLTGPSSSPDASSLSLFFCFEQLHYGRIPVQ